MTTNTAVLTDDAVLKAYEVLKPIVRHTPLQFSAYLSQKYGCNVYLKREDLQAVRSFKIRGAYYAISQVPADVRQRGVVCASAGNHAQGVAWTSAKMAIPATIFMPVTTPKLIHVQVHFVDGNNGTLRMTAATFDETHSAAVDLFVPYINYLIDKIADS